MCDDLRGKRTKLMAKRSSSSLEHISGDLVEAGGFTSLKLLESLLEIPLCTCVELVNIYFNSKRVIIYVMGL